MRRWVSVVVAGVLLGLLVASGKMAGCEQFNRMGISPDGNIIAFSLNEKGGFAVTEESAVYRLDLTTGEFVRVSGDKPVAAWADINSDGDVAFTWDWAGDGEGLEVSVARADGAIHDLTHNRVADVAPQWLDNNRILLESVGPMTTGNQDGDEVEVVLSVLEGREPKVLVRDLYAPEGGRAYVSSLPVRHGGNVAYATADLVQEEQGDDEIEKMVVHFYLVELDGGAVSDVASLSFEKDDYGDPPRYVDLAFSSDGEKLAACFLPENFEEDEELSRLYLIDIDSKTAKLVKSDVNMYYPRFAPKLEGEPYRLLYLSGTGQNGKGRSLNILDLGTGAVGWIITLPGKIMEAYTDWRWLSELEGAGEDVPKDRLRVYHLSDEGLIVAEVDDDGSDLSVRYLSPAKLRRAQLDADLAWTRSMVEKYAKQAEGLQEAGATATGSKLPAVTFQKLDTVPSLSQEATQ